jgi:hypothetical protein
MKKTYHRAGRLYQLAEFSAANSKKYKIKNQTVIIVSFKKVNSIEYLHFKHTIKTQDKNFNKSKI